MRVPVNANFCRGGVLTSPRSTSHVRRGLLSVQAISHVIEQSKHKGNSFVVLLMIANHAHSDGTLAYPSIQTLAKESRISERTVQRTIARLARVTNRIPEAELIVERGGGRKCNSYTIRGVKLSPPTRHIGASSNGVAGVSDVVTAGASRVSPEPSLNRPLNRNTYAQKRRVRLTADELLGGHYSER